MKTSRSVLRVVAPCFGVSVFLWTLLAVPAAQPGVYFPPKGEWAKKSPAELGMDPVKLKEAVDFALT